MTGRPEAPMSLTGRGVLVTRASHQAGPLLEALEALGATAVACPLLSIESVAASPPDLSEFDWLVLTSPNGVRHLQHLLAATASTNLPSGLRVAVVGPGTATAAAAHGWPAHGRGDVATGNALAGFFVDVGLAPGTRVLRVRGDLAPALVEDTLRKLGAVVTALTVYRTRTVAPPDIAQRAIAAGAIDAVAFASGSAVEAFTAGFAALNLEKRLLAACLGPVTAAAARQAGWRRVVVAEEPTSNGLASVLATALGPRDAAC